MSPVLRAMRPLVVVIRLIVPPLILVVGLWTGWKLFSSRAVPELTSVAEVAAPVRVIQTPAMDTTIDVKAWGTVTAARTLALRPEVNGRLVQLDPRFVPGGVFQTGQELALIDRRDYEFAVRQAEAGLETAKFNLEVEQGRGRVAERDWALLGEEIGGDEGGSRMALRAPHLAEKQAALESARSRVDQAKLALERTAIVAPFNAIVVSESAEIGQIVSSGTTLGMLVGTDEYWVEIGVPLKDVPSLANVDRDRQAKVTLATGDGRGVEYDGVVVGLTGSVDSAGRLARVLITVPSPLEQSASRNVPLLLDSYVQVRLTGPLVRDVRELPRSVIREGNRVWIAALDDRLVLRDIEVVGGTDESVLAKVELASGEAIISSPISAVAPGMLIRREVVE
ncbi:MAG: efflux RND transporter periplasmic adaptor subunit [Phycisphaerales bacterium]|nr:efflux RND transporter periplasmic adaptor subunit [Phycisphaerales bacterium]